MTSSPQSLKARDFAVRVGWAVLLIVATTEALRLFQMWLIRVENVPLRAFTIGFLLPLAFVTRRSGRRIGFLSLGLSVILSAYFLMPPHGPTLENISDGASLVFLMVTGCIVVQSIATADNNKRLRDEAQVRVNQEQVLAQIARLARSSTDPSDIRSSVAEIVALSLKADRCYFGLFDEEDGRISDEWHRDGLPTLSGGPVLSAYNEAIRQYEVSGKPVIIQDVRTDPTFKQASGTFDKLLIRSIVRVPMLSNGQVVAVLGAAMANEPRVWTDTEIDFLEVAAAETRAAVESAHEFLREKTIASTLQRGLLPRPTLDDAGLDVYVFYKAALEEAKIGGDFADAFELDADRSALVLGDVSGKGLLAATQIAAVRNMLRYVLYQNEELSNSMNALNKVLAERHLLSGFVTLFVGIYNRSHSTLTYVSCGHEPALLQGSEGEVQRLMPTGMVLGALATEEYRQATVIMSGGDTLLLYTDGASEAGPDRRSQLGVDGVSALLQSSADLPSAKARVTYVSNGVRAAAQGRLHDDVCILGAIVKPSVLSVEGYSPRFVEQD